MEKNIYIEENQIRKERIVLIVYSLYTIVMLVAATFLDWASWVVPLAVFGLVFSWWLSIKQVKTYRVRAFGISATALLSFFIYGLFAQNVFDILVTMGAVVVLLGIFNVAEIIYLTTGISVMLLLYHGFIVRTIEIASAQDGVRKILQIVSFFVIQCVTYYLVKTHVELREELENTIETLEIAEQSKDDFMANVSHEIRTPINTVCGMSEMVLREEISQTVREYAFDIQTAGRNLLSVVSDILDFSELQSGKMDLVEEPYNLTSTVNDVMNVAVAQKNGKDIELIVNCDTRIPSSLLGDEQKIRRVIMNLVSNAIKFTEKGCVIIEITFRREEYGINLCVKVKDTGIGMNFEQLEKLFTSFNQVDTRKNRQEGGVGLGLAISQAMVKKMGGFINVSSEQGKGTEIQFVIPQKVLEERPIVEVKDPENIHVVSYIDMEKYERAEIRDGYMGFIESLAGGLGISFRQCRNLIDLKYRIDKEDYSHVFISWKEYCEDKEYFEKLSEEVKVIMVADRERATSTGKAIIHIYKPFFALSIASVLNGENIIQSMHGKSAVSNRFIAPTASVLVVDDNMMNLKVVEGLLRPYQIKVFTATSGKEALQKIERMDYDFVFMDHMMPEMDGVETLHRIRQKPGNYFKNVPIIALTANAIGGVREMFLAEGFEDFVAKPIELSILERVLRKFIPETKIIKIEESEVEEITVTTTSTLTPMEGIDIEKGIGFCGGRTEDYIEVITYYYHAGEKNQKDLERYYEAEDWKNYTILVHALKSTSKGIGANKLSKMAEKLEEAGKCNSITYIQEKHKNMMIEYRRVLDLLVVNVDTEVEEESFEELKIISRKELESHFSKLKEMLDTFESEGVESVISELSVYAYHGEPVKKLLEAVEEKVRAFDFMGAAEELETIQESMR